MVFAKKIALGSVVEQGVRAGSLTETSSTQSATQVVEHKAASLWAFGGEPRFTASIVGDVLVLDAELPADQIGTGLLAPTSIELRQRRRMASRIQVAQLGRK